MDTSYADTILQLEEDVDQACARALEHLSNKEQERIFQILKARRDQLGALIGN